MPDKTNVYFWDGTTWVPALCNALGKLIIDPSEIFENAPTDDEHGKAPDSDWAYEHNALPVHRDIGARVYHNADQSISNSAWNILAFNSERYDTDVIHDTVTNNSRLTCKTAGKYLITGNVSIQSNTTGMRGLGIFLNGATTIAYHSGVPMAVYGHRLTVSCIYDLAVNDYVELNVFQTSGVALNVTAEPQFSPEFMMQRIG